MRGLDPEFVKEIPGNNEDEKFDNLKEVIPIGEFQYILEAIHKISGIDIDNIEIIKKDYGRLLCRNKQWLMQLLKN
jgi:hypothetical protein